MAAYTVVYSAIDLICTCRLKVQQNIGCVWFVSYLIGTRESLCLVLNFSSYLVEICIDSVFRVQEFAPFLCINCVYISTTKT